MTDEKPCRALVDEAAKRLGRLDILVNNAGMNVRKQPQDFTLDEWRLVMDTNLTSAFVASQAAYPHMKKAGGGKIVNIGSMMSIFGASFTTAYAASKAGIVQLTRALATAWARDNIQVNAVLPGWIDTALTRGAREQIEGTQRERAAPHARRALGRAERSGGDCGLSLLAGFGLRHRDRDPGGRRLFGAGLGLELVARVGDAPFPVGLPLAVDVPADLPCSRDEHAAALPVTEEVPFPRHLHVLAA